MVRVPQPARPSSAASTLAQLYEGHGLSAQTPCDRGYRLDSSRPPSAFGERSGKDIPDEQASTKKKGTKKVERASALRVHVHIREKVITVNAGAGKQLIYWLGATAVHRYLSQPQAYMTHFSHEMTAKAVIADDGAQLARTSRVCDELEDGDHVWIDVGDGALPSRVMSRSFPDRRLFEPNGEEDFHEQIGWRDTEPDLIDDEVVGVDPRLTMSYSRTVLTRQPTFKEWQAGLPASSTSQEGLFDEFTMAWHQVQIDDMVGSSSWMNDVKLTLYHHFESLKYVFASHASVEADGTAKMSLLEFWALCKRCALTSPYANLAKINRMLSATKESAEVHNPQRTMVLHDFMGALTRLSVLRQKSAAKPDMPLPNCLTKILEDNILPLTPGFDTFEPDRAAPNLFTSAAVRQKLTIHETRLKALFRKWSTEDEMRQTINLQEWRDMFRASGVMDADLPEDKVLEAFVVAELGEHKESLPQWLEAGDDACVTLIFSEFVEAILRAALLKFSDDAKTPVDLKIHEMCLLLIFGPAGLSRSGRDTAGDAAPLSGVERRAVPAATVAVPLGAA
jgi:hypothetical protein